MKKLITLSSVLFLSLSTFANCYEQVDQRLQKSTLKQGHSYHGVERKMGYEVVQILKESDELSYEQKQMLGKLVQSQNFEFYVLTASDGPGGYQDLLAVSKESCATYRRYTIYVE